MASCLTMDKRPQGSRAGMESVYSIGKFEYEKFKSGGKQENLDEMDSLGLCSAETEEMSQAIHHCPLHHHRQSHCHCPVPPPNTADFHDSSALESEVNGIPKSLPLYAFDDSSGVSSGFPSDSQGFALGIFDDTHAQGLSLPSEPPELDLRDWILRRRIEHSQQNYVHVNSGAFSPEKLKSRGSSLQGESSSAAHEQNTHEPTESDASKVRGISIFCKRNWEALTSSIDADSGNEKHPHLPTNQRGDLRERANYLDAVPEPSSLNRNSGDEVEEEFDHGKKAGGASLISVDSKTEDESENSITEDESENIIDENVREYQGSDLFSSNVVAPGKENSLRVKLPISLPTTRSSSSTHSLRKPLSDTGNLLLEPQQSQHAVAKWRCPKTDKRHFKPPSKQLSLDRWLVQSK